MGRRRKHDRHLPQRVYLKCGTYWFRPKGAKPCNLGRELGPALAKYGELIHGNWSGRTLGDVIDRYRIDVLPLKSSEKTRENEGAALTRLKAWGGHMLPDNVTQQQLYQYIDRRRKVVDKKTGQTAPAPEAARHEIALLGHVFKKAIRWGVASQNPVAGLEKADRKKQRPPVPPEQLQAVRALATERMRLAIDLAVCMGPRRGNLLTLTRDNCTEEGIEFLNTKGQRLQLIEWSDDLRAIVDQLKALKPQVGPGRFLLRTREGKGYTGDGFSANWQRLMAKHVKAGGQRFTFHDLRSVAADEGTLEEARARLGHASSSTTQRFYRRGVERAKPRS
jgi:integrase